VLALDWTLDVGNLSLEAADSTLEDKAGISSVLEVLLLDRVEEEEDVGASDWVREAANLLLVPV